MKTNLIAYISVSIFAIFIGSQITEGVLLVPYWKSMDTSSFYRYYNEFGPSIGRFYTVLTIIAAIIPCILLAYCIINKSKATKYAGISSLFAIVVIILFYVYFKGTNALFYQAALSDLELKQELIIWGRWHWGRVIMEILSIIFLILSWARMKR